MAATADLHNRQKHVGHGEAAALGYEAKNPLSFLQISRMKQLFQHNIDGSRSGISLGCQVGKPLLIRNDESNVLHRLE